MTYPLGMERFRYLAIRFVYDSEGYDSIKLRLSIITIHHDSNTWFISPVQRHTLVRAALLQLSRVSEREREQGEERRGGFICWWSRSNSSFRHLFCRLMRLFWFSECMCVAVCQTSVLHHKRSGTALQAKISSTQIFFEICESIRIESRLIGESIIFFHPYNISICGPSHEKFWEPIGLAVPRTRNYGLG